MSILRRIADLIPGHRERVLLTRPGHSALLVKEVLQPGFNLTTSGAVVPAHSFFARIALARTSISAASSGRPVLRSRAA